MIERVRRGGKNTPALVAYSSIPYRFTLKIVDYLGGPIPPAMSTFNDKLISLLSDVVKIDDHALRLRIVEKLMK
jgi:hypothetical protein